MKRKHLRWSEGFRVAFDTRRSQAAEMVLPPGGSEGGKGNRHSGAEQWVYVLSGRGAALVAGKRVPLQRGTLLLIERGERHEIKNLGRTPLRTLNFYAPPAFTRGGGMRPAGEP
jgi:mannose-6-phosphate isomerase-like protein (cupin superfamily)